MIVDGLRRCSDSRDNQDEKPGRQMITFLIIANLCMYLWETLEAKGKVVKSSKVHKNTSENQYNSGQTRLEIESR